MQIKKKTMQQFALIALIGLTGLTGCLLGTGDSTGARASGARLARMQASPQWNLEKNTFDNKLGRIDAPWFRKIGKIFFGASDHRKPTDESQMRAPEKPNFNAHPSSGLRVTWMGHSSFLVELEGTRTLVDPVWSERVSPFHWVGPQRFFAPPFPLEQLPPIDAVIISHDHYDHLDRDTVVALAQSQTQWLVPLGIGAHLELWGVPPGNIVELDWWEHHTIKNISITATPSRHFSGRSLTMGDQNATLWAGWAWKGPTRSVFYSGDTALHNDFETIGEKLGPFDVTLMEVGAYNQLWADVHLGPEQAALAHQLVQGNVMIPVHWGLFNLALHAWTEPVERVLIAAETMGIDIAVLRPGASYDAESPARIDRWWPNLPWNKMEQAPAWSSDVEHLQRPLRSLSTKP